MGEFMKELFALFAVICLAVWLALTAREPDEPENFARIVDRYERVSVAWIVIARAGWLLAAFYLVRML